MVDRELYQLHEHPGQAGPVLIVCLDGWIDAGMAALRARGELLSQLDSHLIATFNSDLLLDHRARRPIMAIVDGVNTGLRWPTIELRAAADRLGNDILLLVGAEPDTHWQAFSQAVVDLALELGVELVIDLGAYPISTPHTRPVEVVSTATSPELASRVGFAPGRIEVPATIAAAIEVRCAEAGLPAVGLWAQVPDYAAAMPYPLATIALLEELALIGDLAIGTGDLRKEADATRNTLNELAERDPRQAQYLKELEEQVDAREKDADSIPSADELGAQFEDYLREQS